MRTALPAFTYHPDPVSTGSVVESDKTCEACGESRGWMYSGPLYSASDVEDVCPWCIANGDAAQRFDVDFTTTDSAPSAVPREVCDEIVRRTPGFSGWQQERWLFHCGDGAMYLGRPPWDEIRKVPDIVRHLANETGWTVEEFRQIDPGDNVSYYLFRCRHCPEHLAYFDHT